VELSVAVEPELAQAVVAAIRGEVAALGHAREVALRQVGPQCLAVPVGTLGTGYAGATRPCACGAAQENDHYCSRMKLTTPPGISRYLTHPFSGTRSTRRMSRLTLSRRISLTVGIAHLRWLFYRRQDASLT
jgi:hypothetical protein